jgi:hypothetical protein
MADEESIVEETGRKIGGVGLGAAAGGLVAAPIALGIGAALAPATLGLSLPITVGLVGLGGWLGHKATQRKEKRYVASD